MKNLVVRKLIVVPYALVSLTLAGSVFGISSLDCFEVAAGFYTSNEEVEKNKADMTYKDIKVKRMFR